MNEFHYGCDPVGFIKLPDITQWIPMFMITFDNFSTAI